MKRRLAVIGIALSVILVLVSFNIFTRQVSNPTKEKAVMAGFKILMAKEDVTVAEIIKYLNENINTVSKENGSNLMIGLERVQQARLPIWQKRYEDDELQKKIARIYQNGWTRKDLNKIPDGGLKTILLETMDNGFKVETAEGYYFPVINYTFHQKYQSGVTPDMAAYLEIMAVESNKTPVKDAALMIGWDEILKRAARQEQFIKEYSSSTQVKPIQKLLKRYVSFAMFGCNNTPLFSYNTKRMKPEAKQAYQEYAWDEENGSFSALMKEFLSVLEKNDYRLTNEVDAFRKNAAAMQ